MARPIPYVRTLVTEDGVPIDSVHLAGDDGLAIIVAHGFTLSWQRPAVWRISTRLNRTYGVVASTSVGTAGPAACPRWVTARSTTWTWPSVTRGNWAASGSPPSGSPWGPRSCCGRPG